MAGSINKKGFKALLATQFLGAFNDNAFKLVIAFFAVDTFVTKSGGSIYLALAGVLFSLPYFLFSTYAGHLADHFSKQKIIVWMKVVEVFVMALGLFALLSGNMWFIFSVLFLMGAQSAFFSPSKYGILPEILPQRELSEGNGLIQLWTFAAIILGQACGGILTQITHQQVYYTAYVFITISIIGTVTSIFVTKVEPSGAHRHFQWNFLSELFQNIRWIKQDRGIFLSIIGLMYFGFLGGLFHLNILLYARKIMGIEHFPLSILLIILAIGIGSGSMLAGKFSNKKIELGFVPLGAIGLSIFSIALGFVYQSYFKVAFCLFLLGASAGFYIVPLNAFVQQYSPHDRKGQVLATTNILTCLTGIFASVMIYFFKDIIQLNSAQIFVVLGIITSFGAIYVCRLLPYAFIRLLVFILTHSLYKIRVIDRENMPDEGGALLVSNHVAIVDAVLILCSMHRPIRFLANRNIFKSKFWGPLAKIMGTIPISKDDKPKEIIESLRKAREAILNGELVCIFAEGKLTRTGNMLKFNKGLEHIMNGVDRPIIPVHIDRIWGSIFSFEDGRYLWKMPKAIPYPVTVSFGKAMPADSQAYQVRAAVQELSADAFKLRGTDQKKLHIAFIEEAKKHPFRFCMADSTGVELTYIRVLAGVLLLAKKLLAFDKETKIENEMVGVLFPSTCAAAMLNGAILCTGKIPVNLNFTSSRESIDYAIKECRMTKIISSHRFLEKIKLDMKDNVIFIEDIYKEVNSLDKVKMFILSLILSPSLIKRFFVKGDKVSVDDLATVIFSSGSTGIPKGVMLSHANILSNVAGLYQILNVESDDVVLGVLPFFHSFGFTGTLCFPMGAGIGAVYHSNPLDASTIGKLAQKYKATIIMGTPTFLSSYTRKCTKEQFGSLRYVIAGAEKLKSAIGKDFHEKFGVVPLEGYGASELSPVVAMGIPDYIDQEEHVEQVGYKEGSVGHPIPNVAIRVVDADTGQMLANNQEGLLLVKGPNVMKGYLNHPEKTAEVIKDGWYTTGDIATVDDDGFLCITDRLSRFSKIGGEMVPHIKVEEALLEALGTHEPACAVTAVSDEKKGERLVVLYKGEFNIDDAWKKLNSQDIPKLWIPKREDFYKIDEIPLLGSGKLDLKKIKSLAQEFASSLENKNV